MNEAQRLAKAKADHEAARAEVLRLKIEAEAAAKVADIALGVAERELEAAQMAADKLLPVCARHHRSRRAGATVDEMVIVKRTPKSAVVKFAGHPDDRTSLFKADKDGVYRISPKPTGYWAPTIWIEFPDDTSAPDPV